jgi:S1-C subfamily serine protease
MNRARVEAATVRLSKKGGQGVLVAGGYVLTAAHCVDWNTEGGMTLGDCRVEPIETATGLSLTAIVCAVEPVADIAVLEGPDGQELFEAAEAFEEWCEDTIPVELSDRPIIPGEWARVHVLAHTGEWIRGQIKLWGGGSRSYGMIHLQAEAEIRSGTSGGPVVDEEGKLVGVVSQFVEVHEDRDLDLGGRLPVVTMALPVWVLENIRRAQGQVRLNLRTEESE